MVFIFIIRVHRGKVARGGGNLEEEQKSDKYNHTNMDKGEAKTKITYPLKSFKKRKWS